MATKLSRGLDGRTRDQNPPKAGEIRQKRGDTLVSTLRREYGDNFAAGIRSDAKLETVRERTGKSLHELVQDMSEKKRRFGAWLTASGRSRQARSPDLRPASRSNWEPAAHQRVAASLHPKNVEK